MLIGNDGESNAKNETIQPKEDDTILNTVPNNVEPEENLIQDTETVMAPEMNEEKPAQKPKGKKAKEMKKAAKMAVIQENEEQTFAPLRCNTCTSEFPTRNKLFSHLKSTGHALATGNTPANAAAPKPKKDKRKNK